MPFFKKKPIVIEAIQLNWKNWNHICEFVGDIISPSNPARQVESYSDACEEVAGYIELSIPTKEGIMIAKHGDWIIKGIQGEFYPCKPDIFAATYEQTPL